MRGRIVRGVFLLLPALAAAQQAASPQASAGLAGEWLDSQGNRVRMAESGNAVTLTSTESWEFIVDEKTNVRAELRLEGTKSGNEVRLIQATNQGPLVLNGRLGAEGFIRARMDLPGVGRSVDFALARPRPAPAAAGKRPRTIHMDLLKQSVEIGKWIPMFVGLAAEDGETVIPERGIEVRLDVAGGRPVPPVVKLTPREPRVPAGIAVDQPDAQVVASGPGLEPARASADGCAKGEIQAIRMNITASRAPADGRRGLPVRIAFLGAGDSLVTNGMPKPIGWRLEGVGELRNLPDAKGRPQDIAVAADECVSRNEVVSQEPGAAVVTASFRSFSESATLHFTAPLSLVSILFVLFGGVCGGVVSALQNYRAAVRWRMGRWMGWLLSALAGGVALYLAYYYGVLKVLPMFPSGAGFAFLAGLAGGFLGAAALERIAGMLLPSRARTAEQG